MAKTAEPGAAGRPSMKDVGRTLRQVRKQQGLSRTVVARSAGLTRRELSAYERGRVEVPESDLWCLAGSCGVEVGELLPRREPLRISGDLSTISVGDTVRRLRTPGDYDELVHEYLTMIYELRNLPAGSRIPLRQNDLVALADALGRTPEAIERRLVELIGSSPVEAARLRAVILPPLSLPAAPDHGDPYAVLAHGDALPRGVEDFFAAPAGAGPFSPPPSGVALALATPPAAGFDPAPVAPAPVAFSTLTGDTPVLPAPMVMPPGSEGCAPVDVHTSVAAAPFTTGRVADPFSGPVDPHFGGAAAGADPFGPSRADVPLAAPARPGDRFAGAATAEPSAPRPSDPFAGPVDPQTAAAAAAADPFGLPRGDDPLAPPPLPPDPFSVSTPVAPVDRPGSTDLNPARLDGPAGGLPADLFAPPTPAGNGFGPDPAGGVGVTVLDAIVVDDPLRRSPSAPASEPVATPTPPRLDPPPAGTSPEAAPIAWSAAAAETAPVATTRSEATPRFERAGAQWEMKGIFPAPAIADDGTRAPRRADARWALADLRAPGDFIIEAAVDFRAGAGFGVVFRGAIDGGGRISGYSFDFDPVASGGGYLLRLWDEGRQHWRPLAHTPVGDPAQLYGHHVIRVAVRADQLVAQVDDEAILEIAALSREPVDAGREPCCGDRVGIQAWSTTEVTVETFQVAAL